MDSCLRSVNIYYKHSSLTASFCLMPTGRVRTLPTSDVGISSVPIVSQILREHHTGPTLLMQYGMVMVI